VVYYDIIIVVQVDAVTRKADEEKREADLKLTEFAQLLDIRAQRIKVRILLLQGSSAPSAHFQGGHRALKVLEKKLSFFQDLESP